MSEDQLSPLPQDILIEIFSYVRSRPIYFGSRNDPIWRICLVCRLWKDIAFNTPQLWAYISLSPQIIPGDPTIRDMIKSWKLLLERSGNCSLNLSLDFRLKRAIQHLPLFLEPCFKHVRRWEHLYLRLPLNALRPFMSNLDITYPRLRSLNLGHVGNRRHVPKLDLFKNAPLLRTLFLHDNLSSIQDVKLPWSQITHCDLYMSWGLGETQEVVAISKLIPNLPNLVSLTIFKQTGSDPALRVIETELPHLRKLTLSLYTSTIHALFNSIRAPCLKELEILCAYYDWSYPVERFLLRSGCHLTSVAFGSNVLIKASFLTHLPLLEFLTIRGIECEDTLRVLTLDGSQRVCPRIKRFVLTSNHLSERLWEVVASMVESRLCLSKDLANHDCKLESLHFLWADFPVQDGAWYRVHDFVAALGLLKERLSDRCFIPLTYERGLPSDFK